MRQISLVVFMVVAMLVTIILVLFSALCVFLQGAYEDEEEETEALCLASAISSIQQGDTRCPVSGKPCPDGKNSEVCLGSLPPCCGDMPNMPGPYQNWGVP